MLVANLMDELTVSYPVPYYAQIASPELAVRVFAGELDPLLDPRWHETGAQNVETYAHWVERACGMACLKMCVEALGGPEKSLHAWIEEGVNAGAYLIRKNADGSHTEIGWIHQKIADMAAAVGLSANCITADTGEIIAALRQDKLVIASVSYELGTDFPITHKGGHLVVIWGVETNDGQVRQFILNNPSGRAEQYRQGARIPFERFMQAFTGRVILVHR